MKSIFAAIVLLAASAGVLAEPETAAPAGTAKVVFMSPTRWAMHVSLYRVSPGGQGQEFLGLLSKHQKIEYASPAGDQLFMIIGGENADFLEAHLAPGKTYYAIAAQRTGWIRARYSLLAVRREPAAHGYALGDKDFPEWLSACEAVTPSDRDRQWYEKNLPSIEHKRESYLRKWEARGEEFKERQVLDLGDGQ